MRKIKNARDRIIDEEDRKAYDKYKTYLSELSIYEEYTQKNSVDKIGGIFRLVSLYKKNGIEVKNRKSLVERFKKFSSTIMRIKQENPDLDLRDIGTQKGRKIVSDVICETQNDKKIKEADLDAVAVIENFSLYVALGQVNENSKDKKSALHEYEISQEKFDRAKASYKKYEKSGIIDLYNHMFKRSNGQLPNNIVHYTAGTLELTPSEARRALSTIQVLKGNDTKNSKIEKFFTVYDVSQVLIDNIMRDPQLTPEEKNRRICELEVAEFERVSKNVEEANRLQHTDKYKITRESDQREIG